MTTRITVKIDSELANKARNYARKRKMSIDKVIEKQMKELLQMEEKEIAPAVKELAGILKDVKVKDAKKEFRKHQLNKYRS